MNDRLQPWYVIGHRNPDADAIFSAIGHAAYLQAHGEPAIAARCGHLTERVRLVLERTGLPTPVFIDDVRPTAGSICRRDVVSVSEEDTFMRAYQSMLAHEVRAAPVLTRRGEVCGILRFLDLLQLLLPTASGDLAARTTHASLENIAATLGADTHWAAPPETCEEDHILMVGASLQATVERRLNTAQVEGNVSQYVVICGDRSAVHQYAVDYGARALIITSGCQPEPALARQAEKKGITILCSPHDTAMTVKLALCARRVSHVLDESYRMVEASERVGELAAELVPLHQELFPVVEDGTCKMVGVLSKSDLISPPRTRLSLVDHNEFAQAVRGVEETEVVEVIDHHRLSGDFVTREPVRFLNEPVGSTSTIVARRFRDQGFAPDAATALCLCAGMISDTLNLTSPTTTDLDRELLAWLAGLAGVQPAEFAASFFAAGSLLVHGEAVDIIESDRKEFSEQGMRVSLSQIEELSLDAFDRRRPELEAALTAMREEHDFDLVALLLTNISSHYSLLLALGNEKLLAALEFPRQGDSLFEAPGVVSRKKQLFPAVCHAIAQVVDPSPRGTVGEGR